MADSVQSTSSGWSSFALILATAIPFILFWKPLRYFINEYRLYRRCQQYPHIVVCKDNSSTTTSERISGHGIVGQIIPIGVWLFDALLSLLGLIISLLGLIINKSITALASKISKKESTTAEPRETQLSTSKELNEQVQSSPLRILHYASFEDNLSRGTKVEVVKTTKHNFDLTRRSEEIFESSFENTENFDRPMQKELHSVVSKPLFQQRPSDEIRRGNTAMHSRPPNHRSQTQTVAVNTLTLATMTKSVEIDSYSLSEKMRKRRFNGGCITGHNLVSGEGNEGDIRKKRKLNNGRISLRGSVVRNPRVGAWQTTKILNKREREQREERLLRSMSRKRVKPTIEVSKSIASTTSSTVVPISSTPAFNFGQATAATSTNSNAPTSKHEPPSAVSTPAPAFQFGGNGTGDTEKKPLPTTKTPAFSFGNSSNSTNAASNKPQAPPASVSAPAAPFQFGGPNVGTSGDAKTKGQSAQQVPPKSGTAPSASKNLAVPLFGAQVLPGFGAVDPASTNKIAPSTPAAPAPSFGTTSAAQTQAPAVSGFVAPAISSFGGKSTATSAAPAFTGAPAPSGFGAPAPVAQGFGTTTVPQTTFGAPPAPATSSQPLKPVNVPPISFGNTKENTNPGGFNSTFQAPAPSNGFLKPQPTNAVVPGFGSTNTGGMPGYNAAAPPVSTSGASARRMARRARTRRR